MITNPRHLCYFGVVSVMIILISLLCKAAKKHGERISYLNSGVCAFTLQLLIL